MGCRWLHSWRTFFLRMIHFTTCGFIYLLLLINICYHLFWWHRHNILSKASFDALSRNAIEMGFHSTIWAWIISTKPFENLIIPPSTQNQPYHTMKWDMPMELKLTAIVIFMATNFINNTFETNENKIICRKPNSFIILNTLIHS